MLELLASSTVLELLGPLNGAVVYLESVDVDYCVKKEWQTEKESMKADAYCRLKYIHSSYNAVFYLIRFF